MKEKERRLWPEEKLLLILELIRHMRVQMLIHITGIFFNLTSAIVSEN